MSGRPMSRNTTSSGLRLRELQRLGAGVRDVRRVAFDVQQHAQALGGVGVVVHHQHAAAGRGLPRGAALACGERRLGRPAASGRRTVNVLPWPAPALAADTLPPCRPPGSAPATARCPGRPAACPARRRTCANISNTLSSASGRDADAGVASPTAPPRRLRRRTVSAMRPPCGVYLAALFSRLLTTCAMRVGSASMRQRLRRQLPRQRVAGRCRSAACAGLDRGRDHVLQVDALPAQFHLAAC